jgi:alpha-glucosidase (family GH31 glycosyl hydrolase)
MGFHAASYAYNNLSRVSDNVNNYTASKIPLDGVWFDIPYMKAYEDFTVDSASASSPFYGVKEYVADLRANHSKKIIPIIDAGLQNADDSDYIADANTYGCLIKDYSTGNPVTTKVWPEFAGVNGTDQQNYVFLDWFHADAKKVWSKGLTNLYAQMEFDGIWLDMNEVTSFCNGQTNDMCMVQRPNSSYSRVLRDGNDTNGTWFTHYSNQSENSTFFLPFIPSTMYNFDNMTLSLNATHPSNNATQYDTHNLNGHMESKTTHQALGEMTGKTDLRNFILSRSTFAGSGAFTSHWLGDNHRSW